MFNWYNLKQILLRPIEEMLVEGGTGGGEGARSVCQDPAHLLSHPEVKHVFHINLMIIVSVTLRLNILKHGFHIYLIIMIVRTLRRHRGSHQRHIHVPS